MGMSSKKKSHGLSFLRLFFLVIEFLLLALEDLASSFLGFVLLLFWLGFFFMLSYTICKRILHEMK